MGVHRKMASVICIFIQATPNRQHSHMPRTARFCHAAETASALVASGGTVSCAVGSIPVGMLGWGCVRDLRMLAPAGVIRRTRA
jgi:hypothetical protein